MSRSLRCVKLLRRKRWHQCSQLSKARSECITYLKMRVNSVSCQKLRV
ncbi:hypothetical protein HanRHA438_Chr05g0243421 [Helianthus annuus]|nr:hypothetical protein HanRHA438_Chr05g0243421 [Helianthus annuus]